MSIQSLVGRLVIKTKGEVTVEGELVEQKGNSLVIRCRKPRSSKTFLRYFQMSALEYVSIDGNDVTVTYRGETLDEFEGVILDRIDEGGVFVGANADGGFLMARDWEFYPNDAEEASPVADKKEKEKEKAKPVVQEPSAEEDDFSAPVTPAKPKKEKADVKAATTAKKEKAVTPVATPAVDPEDDDFDSVPPAKTPVIGDHEDDDDFSAPVTPAKPKKEKAVTPTHEGLDDDFDSVPTPKKNEKAAPAKADKQKPAPAPEPEPEEEEEETPKKIGFEVGQTINFTYDGEDYEGGTVIKIAHPVASIRIGGKAYRFVIEEMEDVVVSEPETDEWE